MNVPQFWAKGSLGDVMCWRWSSRSLAEAQYQSFASRWATWELLRQIGNPVVHPEVQPVLKLHDGTTRVESKLQLA